VFNYAPEEIESELRLDRNAARATQG
jgi:hypothetical protein